MTQAAARLELFSALQKSSKWRKPPKKNCYVELFMNQRPLAVNNVLSFCSRLSTIWICGSVWFRPWQESGAGFHAFLLKEIPAANNEKPLFCELRNLGLSLRAPNMLVTRETSSIFYLRLIITMLNMLFMSHTVFECHIMFQYKHERPQFD